MYDTINKFVTIHRHTVSLTELNLSFIVLILFNV